MKVIVPYCFLIINHKTPSVSSLTIKEKVLNAFLHNTGLELELKKIWRVLALRLLCKFTFLSSFSNFLNLKILSKHISLQQAIHEY